MDEMLQKKENGFFLFDNKVKVWFPDNFMRIQNS